MARVDNGREWARRAFLSALAGGGLTAVGIGGPLSGGALASEPPTITPGSSTNPSAETPVQTTSTPTTTTTTPTTTEPAPTPATTVSTPTTTTPPSPAHTTTEPSPKPPAPHAPHVLVQREQLPTGGADSSSQPAPTVKTAAPKPSTASSENIAPAPQLAAAQAEALAAMLADSAASTKALDFYRIPLFLLPIYQAAAVQYGVPWQVLAAINEVETDYGTDVSVSTAGAIGWMQFMPETWLQYGVDAVNAGYADPYNPVDAIFAAARYLHAAGASHDLHAAILAYNHSEAYVESVLLRARLIASYPASVIATLTGLTEGSWPVADATLSSDASLAQNLAPAPTSASNATAGATPLQPQAATASKDTGQPSPALPGSTPAPSPAASAAQAERALNAAAPLAQLSKLVGPKGAPVVAVEDGRIVGLGVSRKLGHYLVLRDTYGDVFTYGGLGSIVPDYRLPKPARVEVPKGALSEGQESSDPKPTKAASAGRHLPLTLHVAKPKGKTPTSKHASAAYPPAAVGIGKVRVYAHPGNPDALAAAHALAARRKATSGGWMKLQRGALVTQGTVLGHLDNSNPENQDASLQFAIRPAGAQNAIDPKPILENWKQLEAALHPQGAKNTTVLAGATASDAFLLSGSELARAVLADPDIKLAACDRALVAQGKVQSRALALLVFLSRSGLKPTVGRLRCAHTAYTASGSVTALNDGDAIELTAINDVPISAHQGAGSITDITIRTLLTLPHKYAPKQIISLMSYPGSPSTIAQADHAGYIEIDLPKHPPAESPATTAGHGHAARAASAASGTSGQAAANVILNSSQWRQLITQIGGLPIPKVPHKPSSSAIHDKPAAAKHQAG